MDVNKCNKICLTENITVMTDKGEKIVKDIEVGDILHTDGGTWAVTADMPFIYSGKKAQDEVKKLKVILNKYQSIIIKTLSALEDTEINFKNKIEQLHAITINLQLESDVYNM